MALTATARERTAGRVVELATYTRVQRNDDPRVRAQKQKKTTEVMQKYNKKTSTQKFALKLAANFDIGDVVACLTFRDECLPKSRTETSTRFRYCRDLLKKEWLQRGLDPEDLIFGWSIEHVHGEGRWHVHCVFTGTGEDYEMLRRCWIYGDILQCDPLRVDEEKNYDTLAAYYAKEAREKLGLRSWSFSRNAKNPYEVCDRVDGDMEPEAPEGVVVIEKHVTETSFGKFCYLKYILPEAPERPRPHAKRKRAAA